MKIFNSKKKYKVKLRYKQPPIYKYLLLPVLCLVIILFFLTLENLIMIFNENFSFPKKLYVIEGFILFILLGFSIFKSPISFSRIQRTKFKLKKVIEENNFYYENNNRIISSMVIKFYWVENNLILEIYPLGGSFSTKMNDLTLTLQTALNLTVTSVQNDYPNHTTYVLSNTLNNFIDSSNDWNIL